MARESEEIHTNGQIYKLYNYPFTDIDGSNLILQLGIDLTRQKAYEKRLIQTEKLLTVAEMSAMISHEFRNSLTSVKMILELQTESNNLSTREKDSLSVVLSSISHMEEIVTQLLNFSQPREPQFGDHDLNKVVEDCIEFTRIHLRKNDIILEKKLDKDIPVLYLDHHAMKETMVNLILNAIQATAARENGPAERKIEITTEIYTMPETVHFKSNGQMAEIPGEATGKGMEGEPAFREGESCVLVTVRDHGIGIRESEIENIFNPFYTDKKQGGTGLGLSLVKRNINAHGGIVKVESKPGQGALFKLYLPLAVRDLLKEAQ